MLFSIKYTNIIVIHKKFKFEVQFFVVSGSIKTHVGPLWDFFLSLLRGKSYQGGYYQENLHLECMYQPTLPSQAEMHLFIYFCLASSVLGTKAFIMPGQSLLKGTAQHQNHNICFWLLHQWRDWSNFLIKHYSIIKHMWDAVIFFHIFIKF